jgi:hypothetical protein
VPEPKRNMGASVQQRLRNLARERGQSTELLLTRYALERLHAAVGSGARTTPIPQQLT